MTTVRARAEVSAVLGKIPAPKPELPGFLAPIELKNPLEGQFRGFCESNRKHASQMVQQGSMRGKVLALCGAGPSLADVEPCGAAVVWACNSAVGYMLGRGWRVDAALGIDQTLGLLREWWITHDVDYLVASSCNPALIDHLAAHDRRLAFFHNAVGFENERDYYKTHWPTPAFMMGHGATVVPRAIGLALWMGFERIDVYGADCALGPNDVAHADGESAMSAYSHPFISHGVINDREWRSRPDMLLAAVDLARYAQMPGGRIRLMGDTLAAALQGKDNDFLDLVMRRLAPGESLPAPKLVSLERVEA